MRTLTMLAALAIAACTPPAQQPTEQAANQSAATEAANNCQAAASAPWTAGGQIVTVEASTTGDDCAGAQATITFRNEEGASLYGEAFPANQVMVLAGAESVADMERRLNEWVAPAGAAPDSTNDLPVWAANAAEPGESEFPFHPAGGMDRATYDALRSADAPMFCFVQGMESQACFTLDAGALRKIGVQQFPG